MTTTHFRKIAAEALHVSEPTWWLKSRFHFSFAGYYNPKNVNFGVLRVLNDDEIKPTGGFPTHPHRDMEIISYVIDGGLTHKDSMGSAETIGRGALQYMSAGSGVAHSEFNKSTTKGLRFLQLWIEPNARGLKPNYGSRLFAPEARLNQVQHVVGPRSSGVSEGASDPIRINQDANIFISEIEEGKEVTFSLGEGRQLYLVCVEGDLSFNGGEVSLTTRDAVEIVGPVDLRIASEHYGHFLAVEMAQGSGSSDGGYDSD